MYQSLKSSGTLQHSTHYQWEPGLCRRAPWTALVALSLVVVCAIAAIVVAVVSNGRAATWFWNPNSILGFFASISISLLTATLSIGVSISWWRAALNPRGTTLGKLHRIWNYGPGGSKVAAWLSGRYVNKIAIVSCTMTIAAIAYQTLLQRSAKYEWNELTSSGQRYLPSIKRFPDGYIGNHTNSEFSAKFTEVVQNYIAQTNPTTYYDPQWACQDSCTGIVPSVGLNVQNSTQYTSVYVKNATLGGVEIFKTSFRRYDTDNVTLFEMIVKYVNGVDSSCMANITTATYTFQAGWVWYPFLVTNITIDTDYTNTVTGFEPVLYPGDSPDAAQFTAAGPLMGMEYVATEYLLSNAILYWDAKVETFTKEMNGTLALQWYDYYYKDSGCLNLRFVDPTVMLSNTFQGMLFWASLDAANKTEAFVELYDVSLLTETLVYVTFVPFLVVATLILAVAFVAVASTLWGWWELGRTVSLSPLETAKAFGAHLFQAEKFDMDPRHLAQNTGQRSFKYGDQGVLDAYGREMRVLRFGELRVGNDPADPGTVHGEYL